MHLGPPRTRDWEPVTITPQPLSLVEKAELVQVHFTLYLRDQRSTWMQDGCKVYMDSCRISNGSCFMVILIVFKNKAFGGRPNNFWFVICHHVWGPTWIEIHWNGIWLRARSHRTSRCTRGSVTTIHDLGGVWGRPLDTFFWALTISWSWLLAYVWSGP